MLLTKRARRALSYTTPVEPRIWGYVRHIDHIEIQEQHVATLVAAGCQPDLIYREVASTHRSKRRPELQKLKKGVRDSDVIAFVSMFEAVAGFEAMMSFIDWARENDRALLFVRENYDTRSLNGRVAVSAGYLYLESRLEKIRRNTKRGLKVARRQGGIGGRPSALSDEALARARALIANGTTMAEVAAALNVSRATLYNAGLIARKN